MKLEQRPWHDLSYTVAYTFSKFMDSGGAGMNMYNRRPEREPAPDNVPHNFILSYVWQLPIGKGKQVNHAEQAARRRRRRLGDERNHQLHLRHELHHRRHAEIPPMCWPARSAPTPPAVKPQRLDPRTNGLLGFNTAAYATPAKGTFGNLGQQHAAGLRHQQLGRELQ